MQEDVQLGLFTEKTGRSTPFLHIIKDGKVVDMSVESIFDQTIYTHIKAVTFVSSPTFFFNTVSGFENVQLILGIGDGNVADSFTRGVVPLFDIENRIDFFKQAPEDVQAKIKHDQFEIRYSKDGTPIHSKFYLLSNDKGDNRLVIGSANFTQVAFSNTKQFEEIMIFDDSPMFGDYRYRFGKLYNDTVDYIPERIKGTIELYTDYDTLKDVLLDEVVNKKIHVDFTEAEMEDIKGFNEKEEEATKDKQQIKEVIEIVTKKNVKENRYSLRTPNELMKKGGAIRNMYTRKSKETFDMDDRLQLEYDEAKDQIYVNQKKSNGDSEFALYSQKQPDEMMKEQVQLIIDFVETYETFSNNDNQNNILENQAKVFEVIMYGLVAPFIWKMKNDCVREQGSDAVRRDFPSFLIIGGLAESGKTILLEFIANLLGVPNKYYSFPQISKKDIMYGLFKSSNLMPILTDEVPHGFFTNRKYDEIIKYVANTLEGKHPVMIGTTNASNFNASQQVLSRIYYIKFNHAFDKTLKVEGNSELKRISTQLNDTLYKDFANEYSNRIRNGEEFYVQADILLVAREIFKEYFTRFQIELPKWFPTKPFNDYESTSASTWREIYKNNREAFIEEDDVLSVRFELISDTLKSFSSKERKFLINLLPSGCIKEDGYFLSLNKAPFYRFIDERNNRVGNDSLLNKIKRIFA